MVLGKLPYAMKYALDAQAMTLESLQMGFQMFCTHFIFFNVVGIVGAKYEEVLPKIIPTTKKLKIFAIKNVIANKALKY